MNFANWAADALVAGAVAATLAALAAALLPRAKRAAARHDAWFAVILAALAGGLAAPILPRIELAWLPQRAVAATGMQDSPGDSAGFAAWWFLYGAVACALIARRVAAERALWRFAQSSPRLESRLWNAVVAQECCEMGIAASVRVVTNPSLIGGATFGPFRPVVVLSDSARSGPSDRWRAVLLHELAHVQRRDPLSAMLAELATALFWFLPWVWHAAARMRIEREVACDDQVVERGARASSYGSVLIRLMREQREAGLPRDALARIVDGGASARFEERLGALLRERGAGTQTTANWRWGLAPTALSAVVLSGLHLVPVARALSTPTVASQIEFDSKSTPLIEAPAPAILQPAPQPVLADPVSPALDSAPVELARGPAIRPENPVEPDTAVSKLPARTRETAIAPKIPSSDLGAGVEEALRDVLRDGHRPSVKIGPISVFVVTRSIKLTAPRP